MSSVRAEFRLIVWNFKGMFVIGESNCLYIGSLILFVPNMMWVHFLLTISSIIVDFVLERADSDFL